MNFAVGITIVALLCVGAIALVYRLFWPSHRTVADADDPWAQHNERRQPSLERGAEPPDTEVNLIVAAQEVGTN